MSLIIETGRAEFPLKPGEAFTFQMNDETFNEGTYTIEELRAHPKVNKMKRKAKAA